MSLQDVPCAGEGCTATAAFEYAELRGGGWKAWLPRGWFYIEVRTLNVYRPFCSQCSPAAVRLERILYGFDPDSRAHDHLMLKDAAARVRSMPLIDKGKAAIQKAYGLRR